MSSVKSKREVTPEQLAKRERFASMVKEIGAMSDAERNELAGRFPIISIEGKSLSVRNQCMIALQRPSSTVVGGFRQWIAAGRCVRKGERGLSILCPTSRKANPDAAAALGVNPADVPDSVWFVPGTVFDVGQTVELAEADAVAA